MFRSRGFYIAAIILIWGLIFCIPFLSRHARSSGYLQWYGGSPHSQKDTDYQATTEELARIKQIEDSKKRKYESKENSDNETANDKRKSEAPEEIKNADVNQSPKNKFEEKDDEIEEPKLHGEVRQGTKCLDTLDHNDGGEVGTYDCHGQGGNQYWFLTQHKHLKNREICIQGPQKKVAEAIVALKPCDKTRVDQEWEYDEENKWLKLTATELCLDSNSPYGVVVKDCVSTQKSQKWDFKPLEL